MGGAGAASNAARRHAHGAAGPPQTGCAYSCHGPVLVDGVTRVACVWVEAFAAAAVERSEPALRETPLAIVAGTAPARRVIEANAIAREAGVRPAMPEAEATARCAALVRRAVAEETLASARRALLDACYGISPRVEDAAPGLVFVDVVGLDRLLGPDAAIADRLARACRGVGVPARVGVAGSRAAARVAARVAARTLVIAPGTEAAALAPIKVTALDWSPPVAAALARWGIATLGELAVLPRDGLAARLGAAGLAAHDLACGRDATPFRPWSPPPFWEEAQALDWEIDALPALEVVLERVLERLTARLAAAHLAADGLQLRLALASGAHHARALALACPMDEAPPMLIVLAHDLAARPPEAPVVGVAVQAHAVPRRAVPGVLGRPASPAVRDLATVLARLVSLVGADNVGAIARADSHRPDAWAPTALRLDDELIEDDADDHARPDAILAFRRLRPPRRVTVHTDPSGRPLTLVGALSDVAQVVRCAGPWRISGDWWDAQRWSREEWDAALDDHTLIRVAHDVLEDTWLLDGVYD
jgi:protein ImuB